MISVAKPALIVALISTLGLTACNESLAIAPGSIDRSDSCAQFQQAIVTARKQENELQLRNIAAGALAGAIIGASVSSDDDRLRGALIGGLLGGATAGVATGEQQRQQRQIDANRLREINGKAGTARSLLTNAGRSAASLRACRLGQIRALERSVRNRQIGTSAARTQLTQLKRRASNDDRIISAAFNGIGNRVERFVDTGARENGVERAILTRQAAARTARARQVRAATPNVARAVTTRNQVQQADARRSGQVDRGLDAIDVLLG